MKALIQIALLVFIVPVALTGCRDNKAAPIELTAKSCRPDFTRLCRLESNATTWSNLHDERPYRAAVPQTL